MSYHIPERTNVPMVLQKRSRATPTSLKISQVRFGAMKHFKIPSRQRMKQTTLVGFASNKSRIKDKPVLCEKQANVLLTNDNHQTKKDMIGRSKNEHLLNPVAPVMSITGNLSDKENFFLRKSTLQLDTQPNFSENQHNTDTNMQSLARTSFECDSPLHTDLKMTEHAYEENSMSECLTASEPDNYDLTMKFLPDSQGNNIFDRFTQKISFENQHHSDILTDSEQQLYLNFKKDLINRDQCQSTQDL